MLYKLGSCVRLLFFLVIILGFIFPENRIIPVKGASKKSWQRDSFWFEPWGDSGVHKGIDIFAEKGQAVIAATNGMVIYKGQFGIGGHILVVLGPKWRLHYYANLKETYVGMGSVVGTRDLIAQVGGPGHTKKNKKPHLHYSLISLLPYVWLWDESTQGWRKMFYLNPSDYLTSSKDLSK